MEARREDNPSSDGSQNRPYRQVIILWYHYMTISSSYHTMISSNHYHSTRATHLRDCLSDGPWVGESVSPWVHPYSGPTFSGLKDPSIIKSPDSSCPTCRTPHLLRTPNDHSMSSSYHISIGPIVSTHLWKVNEQFKSFKCVFGLKSTKLSSSLLFLLFLYCCYSILLFVFLVTKCAI